MIDQCDIIDVDGAVAQWIERRFPKPCVGSSILPSPTSHKPNGMNQPQKPTENPFTGCNKQTVKGRFFSRFRINRMSEKNIFNSVIQMYRASETT